MKTIRCRLETNKLEFNAVQWDGTKEHFDLINEYCNGRLHLADTGKVIKSYDYFIADIKKDDWIVRAVNIHKDLNMMLISSYTDKQFMDCIGTHITTLKEEEVKLAGEKRKPIMHELKSWVGLFEPLYTKTKTHDLRPMDRDYQVGDYIFWREWNVREKSYTGRECYGQITYITSDQHSPCAFSPVALHLDSAILSVKHTNKEDMVYMELV